MALTLQQLKQYKSVVVVGAPTNKKWSYAVLKPLFLKEGVYVSDKFFGWTKAVFYNPKAVSTQKIALAKQKGLPCFVYDELYALAEQLSSGKAPAEEPASTKYNPKQPDISPQVFKGKAIRIIDANGGISTPAAKKFVDAYAGYLKAYGALLAKATPQIIIYDQNGLNESAWNVSQWINKAKAGQISMYSFAEVMALVKKQPPKIPAVPPLSPEFLKNKTITMAGATSGYAISTDFLNKTLAPLGCKVTANFSAKTAVLFYNPKDISNAKVAAAITAGIACYTYASVQTFVQRGLTNNKPDNPTFTPGPAVPTPKAPEPPKPVNTQPLSYKLLDGAKIRLLSGSQGTIDTDTWNSILEPYGAQGFGQYGGQQYNMVLYSDEQLAKGDDHTLKFLNHAKNGKLQAYTYSEFHNWTKHNPPKAIPNAPDSPLQPFMTIKPNQPPLSPALLKGKKVTMFRWDVTKQQNIKDPMISALAGWLKVYGAILVKNGSWMADIIFFNPADTQYGLESFFDYQYKQKPDSAAYTFKQLADLINSAPPTLKPVPPLSEAVVKGATITFAGKTLPGFSMKETQAKMAALGVTITNVFKKNTSIVCFNSSDFSADKVAQARQAGIYTYTYESLRTFIQRGFTDKDAPKVSPTSPSSPPKQTGPLGYNLTPVPPGVYQALIYPGFDPKIDHAAVSALKSYYGSGYHFFNDPFTHGTSHSDHMKQYVEDLLLILQMAGETSSQLYRGVKHPDAVGKYWAMNVGDTFIKPAFMSTSWKTATPYGFAGWNKGGYHKRVMLDIDGSAVTGKKIYNIGEDELLLKPRTRWLILDKIFETPEKLRLKIKATDDPQLAKPKKKGTASAALEDTALEGLTRTGKVWLMPDDGQR